MQATRRGPCALFHQFTLEKFKEVQAQQRSNAAQEHSQVWAFNPVLLKSCRAVRVPWLKLPAFAPRSACTLKGGTK